MALTDKLTAIADAIRAKTGTTDGLTLDGMVTAIEEIPGGGGGSSGGSGIPQSDIDAAFAALAEKGVTVPDGATSADLDDLIASIVAGGGGGGVVTGTVTIAEDIALATGGSQPIVTHNLNRDIAGIATIVEYAPLTEDGSTSDKFLYPNVLYASLYTNTFYTYYHTKTSSTSLNMSYCDISDYIDLQKLCIDNNNCRIPINQTRVQGKWLAGMRIRWFVW